MWGRVMVPNCMWVCKPHAKAQTLLHNWTLDLAQVSGHKPDLVRVLFGETLKKNKLLTAATCRSEGFGCERLSLFEAIALGFVIYLVLSTFYENCAIYSFGIWCRKKGRWVGCEWQRSTRLEGKLLKCKKPGVSCVDAYRVCHHVCSSSGGICRIGSSPEPLNWWTA